MVPADQSSPAEASALSAQVAALCGVAAAAALRSPNALWLAVEEAFAAGATPEAVNEAVMAAVRAAADAVERDAAPTLWELQARLGTRERWGLDQT